VLCYFLLEEHGVIENFALDRAKLLAWLSRVEEGYIASNPYHNALHAADVTANMDYFLRQPNLQRHVNALDILASLLAAMIHDLGEFAWFRSLLALAEMSWRQHKYFWQAILA